MNTGKTIERVRGSQEDGEAHTQEIEGRDMPIEGSFVMVYRTTSFLGHWLRKKISWVMGAFSVSLSYQIFTLASGS